MTEDRDVERFITLEGTPERVWRSLTDPREVKEWLGTDVEWDLQPGGLAHFSDNGREGRIEELDPPRKMSFDWWPEGRYDLATRVTYELGEPGPDGTTQLRVTESPVEVLPATEEWSPDDQAAWETYSASACAGCSSPYRAAGLR